MPEGPAALDFALAPARIGALELPHRIVMGSMHLGVEADPDAGERLAAFYRERALGGAGLIVTGGWAVSADAAADHGYGLIGSEAGRRALTEIAGAGEGTEAAMALQLFHAGRYSLADAPGEVVAPSAIASRVSRAEPRALGEDEVWDVIADFAAAARAARELGFAAVEVMGSEGYLVDQFLSPATNRREDSWGGDAEGRMRFGVELATAVRDAVGPNFPFFFRLTGAELMPESRQWAEVEAFAAALVAAGVDALNVGVGWHESPVPTVQGAVPEGAWLPWAAALREAVGGAVPVIAGNRVNRVADAAIALATEAVDFVSMSRPFLADPEIVAKARVAGRATNVCISCNQACIDRSLSADRVSCLVNPRAGFEREFEAAAQVATRRRFAVIGGGPAGMEAARALAALGAEVELFEAAPELGGQFRLARMVPGKEDYGATIAYFTAELERLGVAVRLGRALDEDDADLLAGTDGVVLATGVRPRRADIPGVDSPAALDYHEAFESLAGTAPSPTGLEAAGSVAIVGAGGIGIDFAHLLTHSDGTTSDASYERFFRAYDVQLPPHLADRGFPLAQTASERTTTSRSGEAPRGVRGPRQVPRVTLMRRGGRVGDGIGRSTRWVWLDALKRAGVETRTGLAYRAITEDGVEIEIDDGQRQTVAADRVVIAAGQERNDDLLPLLERLDVPHRVVGGAADPAELNAVRAFAEGLRAAYSLAG